MFLRRLHPVLRLYVWLVVVVSIQRLELAGLAIAGLLLPVLGVSTLLRGWRLVIRARWLLISLVLVYSWSIAGEGLWNGPMAPTYEGIVEALLQAGRLSLMMMIVAALLEAMSLSDWLLATHGILWPFRRLVNGSAERAIVRLMLVLRHLESMPKVTQWRELLKAPDDAVCETITVQRVAIGRMDWLVTIAVSVCVVSLCFR